MQQLFKIATRGAVKDNPYCTVYGSYEGGEVVVAESGRIRTFPYLRAATDFYRQEAQMAVHNGIGMSIQRNDSIHSHLIKLEAWCKERRAADHAQATE